RRRSARHRHVGAQKLHRVPKRDPLRLHHPVDDRAARLACPQAVPEVLLRRHHQARRPVVVKRAPTDELRPVLLELDSSRLDQTHELHLALEPLDLRAWDSRHPFLLPKSVKSEGGFYLPFDGVLRYILLTYTGQAKKGAITKTASTLPGEMPKKVEASSEFGRRRVEVSKARGHTQVQLSERIVCGPRVVSSYDDRDAHHAVGGIV